MKMVTKTKSDKDGMYLDVAVPRRIARKQTRELHRDVITSFVEICRRKAAGDREAEKFHDDIFTVVFAFDST